MDHWEFVMAWFRDNDIRIDTIGYVRVECDGRLVMTDWSLCLTAILDLAAMGKAWADVSKHPNLQAAIRCSHIERRR